MTSLRPLGVLALALLLGACKSGGDDNSCVTEGGAPLACTDAACNEPGPWPKFRRDVANSGRTNAPVGESPVQRWVFPPDDPFPEAITTSPVIGTDGEPPREYVSIVARRRDDSSQQQLYRLRADDRAEDGSFVISGTARVSGTPALSANGRIIVPFVEDTSVREFDPDGTLRATRLLGAQVFASPNIDREGTVYIAGNGSSSGSSFLAICANGGLRFAPLIGGNPSAAAIIERRTPEVSDDLFVVGAADGIVHAFDIDGRQQWQFVASDAVEAAPIVNQAAGLVYVTDVNGRIFAVRITDGLRCAELRDPLQPAASGLCGPRSMTDPKCVTASPAFGRERLYVATQDGTLHSFDVTGLRADTCDVPPPGWVWRFPAEGSIGPILSSPALATGTEDPVIVFGADDGFVYAVTDAEASGVERWRFFVESPVGTSSPAIGSDGAVYIGTTGGRLYAISTAP